MRRSEAHENDDSDCSSLLAALTGRRHINRRSVQVDMSGEQKTSNKLLKTHAQYGSISTGALWTEGLLERRCQATHIMHADNQIDHAKIF